MNPLLIRAIRRVSTVILVSRKSWTEGQPAAKQQRHDARGPDIEDAGIASPAVLLVIERWERPEILWGFQFRAIQG